MKEMFERLTLRIAEQMTPPPWYDKLTQVERYEWYCRQYQATEQLRRTAAHLFRSGTNMNPLMPMPVRPGADQLSCVQEE